MPEDKFGGGSYIESSDWIKSMKAITNLINKDDECFQYAAIIALSFGKTKKDLRRVSNIKPFVDNITGTDNNNHQK